MACMHLKKKATAQLCTRGGTNSPTPQATFPFMSSRRMHGVHVLPARAWRSCPPSACMTFMSSQRVHGPSFTYGQGIVLKCIVQPVAQTGCTTHLKTVLPWPFTVPGRPSSLRCALHKRPEVNFAWRCAAPGAALQVAGRPVPETLHARSPVRALHAPAVLAALMLLSWPGSQPKMSTDPVGTIGGMPCWRPLLTVLWCIASCHAPAAKGAAAARVRVSGAHERALWTTPVLHQLPRAQRRARCAEERMHVRQHGPGLARR